MDAVRIDSTSPAAGDGKATYVVVGKAARAWLEAVYNTGIEQAMDAGDSEFDVVLAPPEGMGPTYVASFRLWTGDGGESAGVVEAVATALRRDSRFELLRQLAPNLVAAGDNLEEFAARLTSMSTDEFEMRVNRDLALAD